MRRRARKDGNHGAIVDALVAAGVLVVDTSQLGDGFPDIVCGYQGLTVLMELKLPQSAYEKGGAGGKRDRATFDPQFGFTEDEKRFHARWTGQPIVTARTPDEALKAMGL